MWGTFKIWEKGTWKEHFHSPRQCSWQPRAALEPGSPNKAVRVNIEQLLNQAVPLGAVRLMQSHNFPINPMVQSTGGNFWLFSNNIKVQCICSGISYLTSADHQQTIYTLAGYLLNKLHLCSCGVGAHATGWDAVWIGSRESQRHSFLGLGMCVIAAERWIADTKLPTTSSLAAVVSPHTLLCSRTGGQRTVLSLARDMAYLPPFGSHFNICSVVNSCDSSTCLFLTHHPLTADAAFILSKLMTTSTTRKLGLL